MPVDNIIFDSSGKIIKNKNLEVFMTFNHQESKKNLYVFYNQDIFKILKLLKFILLLKRLCPHRSFVTYNTLIYYKNSIAIVDFCSSLAFRQCNAVR